MAKTTPQTARRKTGRKVLLVIDMLNGFLDPKGALYCGKGARAILPYVRRKVQTYARRGDPAIFLCDNHKPDDAEFQMFPAHCVRGTWEAEIVPEIPVPRGARVLAKTRYSGLHRTGLARRLHDLGPEIVEVVGVCTNICVLYTVADLRNRGYRVRVPVKGVASFDRKAHNFALEQMKTVLGADVV